MGLLCLGYGSYTACSPSHCECVEVLVNANEQIQQESTQSKNRQWNRKVQQCVVQYEGVQKNEHTGVATINNDPEWFSKHLSSSLDKARSACLEVD